DEQGEGDESSVIQNGRPFSSGAHGSLLLPSVALSSLASSRTRSFMQKNPSAPCARDFSTAFSVTKDQSGPVTACAIPGLRQIHAGTVAGLKPRFGIDVLLGVVDGGGSFAEAGGDQFHFSGVMGDVAGGINAGNVGFHFRIDQDGPFFNVQAPVLDRAQGGDETE